MIIESQQQIAEVFGVSQKTIVLWQRDGFPVHERGGGNKASLYDTAACIEWRIREQSGAKFDLQKEKARYTHHLANIAQMEYDERRGELLRRDEVVEFLQSISLNVRARLLGMPSRVVMRLANCEPAEMENILREQIYETLTELSRMSAYTADAAGTV